MGDRRPATVSKTLRSGRVTGIDTEVAIDVQAICDHNLIFTNVVARGKGRIITTESLANLPFMVSLRDGVDG